MHGIRNNNENNLQKTDSQVFADYDKMLGIYGAPFLLFGFAPARQNLHSVVEASFKLTSRHHALELFSICYGADSCMAIYRWFASIVLSTINGSYICLDTNMADVEIILEFKTCPNSALL